MQVVLRHLSAALVAASLLFPVAGSAAEPVVIKFAHVVSENTPKGLGARHFATCAETTFPGRVTVEVYPNSQLFGDDRVLEALLLGDVQIAAPSLSKFGGFTDKLVLFDLPFLFDDLAAADRFQHSAKGRDLLRSMESQGLTGLAYWHNGMKQLSASVPLRVPADARGQTFRIMGSDVLKAQFEAVGAVPVERPFSEVFSLLKTTRDMTSPRPGGAIVGQENTWSNIYSQKFFEVQPYITETNHGLLDYMVVTSTTWWQSLDRDLRAGLAACMEEATAVANAKAVILAQQDRKKIVDSGLSQVISLTPDQRAQWVAAMNPVWEKFADQIGQDLIDAAQAANATPPPASHP
jgi:C4-dicarboxylate-binding protein DctP